VENEGWSGHSEALLPTFAMARGFSVVDIGDGGAFVPEAWRGRHYVGEGRPDATFRYRPPLSDEYFHEAPERFPTPGLLYHPVKIAEPPAAPSLLGRLGLPRRR
jgi:hypothetical protein